MQQMNYLTKPSKHALGGNSEKSIFGVIRNAHSTLSSVHTAIPFQGWVGGRAGGDHTWPRLQGLCSPVALCALFTSPAGCNISHVYWL